MAGEKVFDNVRTITSQKVTFEINDWQNDLVRLFLSMAAKLRQVFLAEATGFFFQILHIKPATVVARIVVITQNETGSRGRPSQLPLKRKVNRSSGYILIIH